MELFQAHQQWANRPKDETFATIAALAAATLAYRQDAAERLIPINSVRVENQDDDIVVTRGNQPALLTYKGFGQLATRAGAPAAYLRTLPPTLAAQNLNHGLAKAPGTANLLFHKNGGLVVRAITTEKYVRIWHHEIAQRALELAGRGWEQPKTRGGDLVPSYFGQGAPELFFFLANEGRTIESPTGRKLTRGVFYSNSETGDASIQRWTFLYDYICGNHIVWGASEVKQIRLRHVGTVRERLQQFEIGLTAYLEGAASLDEAKIARAANYKLAATKEGVLDLLFKLDVAPRATLGEAYDVAEKGVDAYGDPRTAWGFVNGLTEVSQQQVHVEDRVALDQASAKVLALAF